MFLNGAIMNKNYKGFREIRSAPFPKQLKRRHDMALTLHISLGMITK